MSMISRQKLIEELNMTTEYGFYGEFMDGSEVAYTLRELMQIIDYQPPADQWIPCSVREPEDPCVYTVEDSSPYTVKKFGKPQRYVWKVLPYSLEMYHRLVAWKPIDPEPYKGVE